MPEVTVLYFAAASTATGRSEEKITIPDEGLLLSSLKDVLSARYPDSNLKKVLATSKWSVDVEMVEDPSSVLLRGGEEIGVICPVSGG
ncbi:hypothetical protein C8J56DRAFT_779400 [Mycena floridula]|nr:hypothetical protein C8J56DRAFT_779400 [Mycena floridula]